MSTCLIVPYFGKFPETFPLWLKCCKNNPEFNWLILTDDKAPFDYPDNVRVIYSSFEEMNQRISACVGSQVHLTRPYKLCDVKPLYGDIFREELKGFSHWGYCDLDLIFGNLEAFFTKEIIEAYDKISVLGHMSILKNTAEIVTAYQKCDYLKILNDPRSRTFDEVRFQPNINLILKESGFKVLDTIPYADIGHSHFSFYCGQYLGGNCGRRLGNDQNLFSYENGRTYHISLINHCIQKEEVAYFHFQKRKIQVSDAIESDFLLVPNWMIPYEIPTLELFHKYAKDNHFYFVKNYSRRICCAIKNRIRR